MTGVLERRPGRVVRTAGPDGAVVHEALPDPGVLPHQAGDLRARAAAGVEAALGTRGREDPRPVFGVGNDHERRAMPTTASSSIRASVGSMTLMVVMPNSRAGFRFTPRSSRKTAAAGSISNAEQAMR